MAEKGVRYVSMTLDFFFYTYYYLGALIIFFKYALSSRNINISNVSFVIQFDFVSYNVPVLRTA